MGQFLDHQSAWWLAVFPGVVLVGIILVAQNWAGPRRFSVLQNLTTISHEHATGQPVISPIGRFLSNPFLKKGKLDIINPKTTMDISIDPEFTFMSFLEKLFRDLMVSKSDPIVQGMDLDGKFELIRLKSYGWIIMEKDQIMVSESGTRHLQRWFAEVNGLRKAM